MFGRANEAFITKKELVIQVQVTPPFKEGHTRFTTVFFKDLSDKCEKLLFSSLKSVLAVS